MTHLRGSTVWPTTDSMVPSMNRSSFRAGVIKTYVRSFADITGVPSPWNGGVGSLSHHHVDVLTRDVVPDRRLPPMLSRLVDAQP